MTEPTVLPAAVDPALRAGLATRLTAAGLVLAARPGPGTVVVAAGRTVAAALAARPLAGHGGGGRLVVLADAFGSIEVLDAVRAGALAVLESAAEGARLAGAVRSAGRGEGSLPRAALLALLDGGPVRAAGPPAPRTRSPLTARQLAVLALIAEGHGNAAIARALSCSAHTVKNVIYDLMSRLQVRNRSQAVAHAVRAGLI